MFTFNLKNTYNIFIISLYILIGNKIDFFFINNAIKKFNKNQHFCSRDT